MRGLRRIYFISMVVLSGHVYAQPTILIADYISQLERLSALIANDQLAFAKPEAAALAGSTIVSPRGNFHADDSLLAAIGQARGNDRVVLKRIELTLAELRGAAAPGAAPDPKLLQQVATEQDVPELARGGELKAPAIPDVPLLERVFRSIGQSLQWLGKKIVRLIEWIDELLPHGRPEKSGTTSGMRWIVIAVVALIVIGIIILAVEVTRRSRRAAAQTLTSNAPLRSTRDDDPLSRGATEWERYAAQLAADGRFREAIRAWFHAVLVTCYASGVLHFRKGRTNWEYIASLPPSTAWRPDLMRLTQRFEQAWYGSEQSTRDDLDDCSGRAQRILDELHRDATERGAA
jgi:Domain of unknown function (DUF4129)